VWHDVQDKPKKKRQSAGKKVIKDAFVDKLGWHVEPPSLIWRCAGPGCVQKQCKQWPGNLEPQQGQQQQQQPQLNQPYQLNLLFDGMLSCWQTQYSSDQQ
jgi:hypothetical protein